MNDVIWHVTTGLLRSGLIFPTIDLTIKKMAEKLLC
jgi:hypothetical protein